MEDSRQMIPAGAPGATALETWLSLYGIRPNTIRYTGTFNKRILLSDGSLSSILAAEVDESGDVDVSEGSGSDVDQLAEESENSDDDGGHDGNAFHSFGFRLLPMGNLHLDAPDHGFRHTVWIIRHQ